MAPPKKTSTAYKDSPLYNIVAILKEQIPLLKNEFAESTHPLTDHAMKELDAISNIINLVEEVIRLFDQKRPSFMDVPSLLAKIPTLISIILSFDPDFTLRVLEQGNHVKSGWSNCFVLQGKQLSYIDKKKNMSPIANSDVLLMPNAQNKKITKDTFTRHPAMEKLSIISQHAFLHNFPEKLQAFVPFLDLSFPIDLLSNITSILTSALPKKAKYTDKRAQDYVRDINEKMLKKTKNEDDAQRFYSEIRQDVLTNIPILNIDELINSFLDDHLKTYKISEASDSIDDLVAHKKALEAILSNLETFNVSLKTYLNDFYRDTNTHLVKKTVSILENSLCPNVPEFSELQNFLKNINDSDLKEVRKKIRLLIALVEEEGPDDLFKALKTMLRETPAELEPEDLFYHILKNGKLIYLSKKETHELYAKRFENLKQARVLEIQEKIKTCDQQIAVFQTIEHARQTYQNFTTNLQVLNSLEEIKQTLQTLSENINDIQNDLNVVKTNRGNSEAIEEHLKNLHDLKVDLEAKQKTLNDEKKKAAYNLLMTSVTSARLEEFIGDYEKDLSSIQKSLTDCQNRFTKEKNILDREGANLLLLALENEETLKKIGTNPDEIKCVMAWDDIQKGLHECTNAQKNAREEIEKIEREEEPLLKREAELNEKIRELKEHQGILSLIEELNKAITLFKKAEFKSIEDFKTQTIQLIGKLGSLQLAFNNLPPIKYDGELRTKIENMMNEAAICLQDEIRNRITAICDRFNETAEELKQDSIALNQVDYTDFSPPSTELARDLHFFRGEMNVILDMIAALPPQYRPEQNIEETFEEAFDAFKQSLLNVKVYIEQFHESSRNIISIFSNETKHQTRDFFKWNRDRMNLFDASFELFNQLNLSNDFYGAYQTLLGEAFPFNLATLQNELLTFSQEQKTQNAHLGERIAAREEKITAFMNDVLTPYMERTRRERRPIDFISTKGTDKRQTHVDDIQNILNIYKSSGDKENTLLLLNGKLGECETHPALSSIIRQAMLSVLDFEARVPTHYNFARLPEIEIPFDALNNAYLGKKIENVPLRTNLRSLRDTVQTLGREGSLLTEKGQPEGAILTQLQQSLKLDLYIFLESFDENANDNVKRLAFKNFQEKFTLRLHSQDFALRQSVHFHSIFPLLGAIKKAFAKLCNYFEFEYFNALSTRASRYRVFQANEVIGNTLNRLENSFQEPVIADI